MARETLLGDLARTNLTKIFSCTSSFSRSLIFNLNLCVYIRPSTFSTGESTHIPWRNFLRATCMQISFLALLEARKTWDGMDWTNSSRLPSYQAAAICNHYQYTTNHSQSITMKTAFVTSLLIASAAAFAPAPQAKVSTTWSSWWIWGSLFHSEYPLSTTQRNVMVVVVVGVPSMQLFSRNIASRKFSLHIKYVMELGWNGVCHSSFGSSLSYFQYT